MAKKKRPRSTPAKRGGQAVNMASVHFQEAYHLGKNGIYIELRQNKASLGKLYIRGASAVFKTPGGRQVRYTFKQLADLLAGE